MNKRGKFVVIEGGVGCGKSTLFRKFRKNFPSWEYYREPGSTQFGERVRRAVQGLNKYKVDNYAALFAYSSARANLVRGVIIPALNEGKTVVLDRYWYSTYAYQGAEGVSRKDIIRISKIATGNLIPDLTIYLDLPEKYVSQRKTGMKDADRYDLKRQNFFKKARQNYRELSKRYTSSWHTLDALKPKNVLYKETISIFEKKGLPVK